MLPGSCSYVTYTIWLLSGPVVFTVNLGLDCDQLAWNVLSSAVVYEPLQLVGSSAVIFGFDTPVTAGLQPYVSSTGEGTPRL